MRYLFTLFVFGLFMVPACKKSSGPAESSSKVLTVSPFKLAADNYLAATRDVKSPNQMLTNMAKALSTSKMTAEDIQVLKTDPRFDILAKNLESNMMEASLGYQVIDILSNPKEAAKASNIKGSLSLAGRADGFIVRVFAALLAATYMSMVAQHGGASGLPQRTIVDVNMPAVQQMMVEGSHFIPSTLSLPVNATDAISPKGWGLEVAQVNTNPEIFSPADIVETKPIVPTPSISNSTSVETKSLQDARFSTNLKNVLDRRIEVMRQAEQRINTAKATLSPQASEVLHKAAVLTAAEIHSPWLNVTSAVSGSDLGDIKSYITEIATTETKLSSMEMVVLGPYLPETPPPKMPEGLKLAIAGAVAEKADKVKKALEVAKQEAERQAQKEAAEKIAEEGKPAKVAVEETKAPTETKPIEVAKGEPIKQGTPSRELVPQSQKAKMSTGNLLAGGMILVLLAANATAISTSLSSSESADQQFISELDEFFN